MPPKRNLEKKEIVSLGNQNKEKKLKSKNETNKYQIKVGVKRITAKTKPRKKIRVLLKNQTKIRNETKIKNEKKNLPLNDA